jgi:hypothetical protein
MKTGGFADLLKGCKNRKPAKNRDIMKRKICLSLLFSALVLWSLDRSLAAELDGWLDLFDGQSLKGWKESGHSFRIVNGAIAADGATSHLFYAGESPDGGFKNFELEVVAMARHGANSGIYFHTEYQEQGWPEKGFEVQIDNTQPQQGDYLENKKTASLYGIRNIYKQLVQDDEWFTLQVTVKNKHVTIRLNDELVVDYTEAQETPPAGQKVRRLGRGTFAIQCHDPASKVFVKRFRVKPLPDVIADDGAAAPLVDDLYWQIIRLGGDNYPLVDFHTHLKGGLTLDEALANSRQVGLNYGVAINCGLGFPITNDTQAIAALRLLQGHANFVGMQAEGREWVKLFSPETVAQFDYVFTDGMTLFDRSGKRTRLWIPDEVQIEDKQLFMDHLVTTIVKILDTEPIDIYVNPTFLPDVIAAEYDALWTSERMQKVVDAAVRNGVAIELNSRYRLPGLAFLKLAKKAGAKFTLGTNNADKTLGRDEYGLQMVQQLGLSLWMPKPDGQKPIQVRKPKA